MAPKHWQKKFGQAEGTLENEDLTMIEMAQVVLAIYGILLIVGGIIGKTKSGSSASLFAGAICGIAALIGYWQSLSDPAVGFLTGGLVGLLLTGIFMSRFVRTRKFMPAGLVLLLSLLVGILTMMARQEYLLNQDKPVEELTKKGQEQCPWPNV